MPFTRLRDPKNRQYVCCFYLWNFLPAIMCFLIMHSFVPWFISEKPQNSACPQLCLWQPRRQSRQKFSCKAGGKCIILAALCIIFVRSGNVIVFSRLMGAGQAGLRGVIMAVRQPPPPEGLCRSADILAAYGPWTMNKFPTYWRCHLCHCVDMLLFIWKCVTLLSVWVSESPYV